MSLEELTRMHHRNWTKNEALNCWVSFSAKYNAKYGGALHHVIIQGELDKYIERESAVFARYARMYGYRLGIPPIKEMNH
jgi:hypothetical protein